MSGGQYLSGPFGASLPFAGFATLNVLNVTPGGIPGDFNTDGRRFRYVLCTWLYHVYDARDITES